MGDDVFINEAFSSAFSNYFKYKDQPDLLAFNTFDVVVIRMIIWLFGEESIKKCIDNNNEHSVGGFDFNFTDINYPIEKVTELKDNFRLFSEFDKENKESSVKRKNPYMDKIQKSLIDVFFCKKAIEDMDVNQTKEFYDFLFSIKSTDFYKQSYAILTSEDPYEIVYYFNFKMFKEDNKYTYNLYRVDVLDSKIYEFFDLDNETISNLNQKQINKVNEQIYEYYQIDVSDLNKVDKLITAINNTRKKPKLDIKY